MRTVTKSTVARLLLCSLVLLATASASAQQNKRDQRCFNEKEAEAEAEVRTGIQLREMLRRCAAVDLAGQTALESWYRFDQENGDRLRAAVNLRRQALSRIYRDRTRALQWETDAVAATTKAIQVNDGVCKAAYDVIERLTTEGWAGFKHYARLQGNLLDYEIPLCRK